MSFQTPTCEVAVYTPEGLKAYFGLDGETEERGLRLRGCVLGVRSLSQTRDLLKQNGVDFFESRHRIVVVPKEGQGAALLFEEDAT